MSRPEALHELTESYLKAIIAEVADTGDPDLDPAMPFKEMGIDSFRVLKILRRLEEDFGTLPKTLLFENVNIEDLTGYLVDRYDHVLVRLFAVELDTGEAVEPQAAAAP